MVDAFDLSLDLRHELVGLVLIIFQDALHLDLEQSQVVVAGDVAQQLLFIGCELLVEEFHHGILVGSLLEAALLVHALFDEDALQRGEEELFLQLTLADEQLLAQQAHGAVGAVAQHVADGEEARFVVLDDAAVGRDIDLAVREGIEGVDGLVGRGARGELYLNLHVTGCHVDDAAGLDLAFLDGFGDGVLQSGGCFGERHFADDKRLVVELVDLGTDTHHAAALPVVVFAHVDGTAGGEVGIEMELLALEVVDGGVAELVEVMGQHLAGESHSDAVGTLCQQQREFHGQGHRLLVASVVAHLPISGLRVEDRLKGKLRESCLDISGSGGTVTGEDVTPVALRVDEQILLSELHESVADGGVAVRVELHGVSHDVGHLVVASVVHALHRVKDTALHRFQSILDLRHSALKDDIGGIVQKPVLVHAAEMMHGRGIKAVGGLVVGVCILGELVVVGWLFALVGIVVAAIFQLFIFVYSLVVVHKSDWRMFLAKLIKKKKKAKYSL